MNTREAGRFLRAFGDGTRLRIIALLAKGGLTVGQMARILERSGPIVTRHLQYLHARGVVARERKGKSVVYRLAAPNHPLQREMLKALRQCVATLDGVSVDAAARQRTQAGEGRRTATRSNARSSEKPRRRPN